MRISTPNFDSLRSACNYYSSQGITRDEVKTKLSAKVISLGYPKIDPDKQVIGLDKDGRYYIEDKGVNQS